SIGDADERRAHRAALIAHFERHRELFNEDEQRRLQTNPLRLLDSKNPALQPAIAAAPKLVDSLGVSARAHFDEVQQLLADHGIAFTINPRLVRGLDYYNRTVFEWVTDRLGAQGTVAGGGRYDGLFEQLGGKPTPACGFAIGSERMVLLLQGAGIAPAATLDAYVVHVGGHARRLALSVAEMLRDAGFSIAVNAGGGSFKAQMKRADVSGARFALIVGEDEAAANRVALKPLRSAGDQLTLAPADLAARLAAQRGDGSAS
ncbi:MAG TPA: histidine--tRNA ligase, partial [Casimicrobiaceae bacterium]|nr:histidine--tRNA ligase [Casimicrobiaceae bacterium]